MIPFPQGVMFELDDRQANSLKHNHAASCAGHDVLRRHAHGRQLAIGRTG